MPNTDPVEFDPTLDVPIGLKFAVRKDEDPYDDEESLDDGTDGDDADEDDEGDDDESELAVPTNIRIISQTVRNSTGGRQVVDTVLSVDDVKGALKYEVRITKA